MPFQVPTHPYELQGSNEVEDNDGSICGICYLCIRGVGCIMLLTEYAAFWFLSI